MMRLALSLSVAAGLLLPCPAEAAGGADVVDDAFVEAPGVCHVESWATFADHGSGLDHLGIGCTPREPHRLELDFAAERTRDAGGHTALIEPGIKYTVLVRGLLALGGYATVTIDARHSGSPGIAAIGAASVAVGKYSTLNLDLGWQRAPRGGGDALFWGGQVEERFAPHLSAIAEVFGDARHSPGAQGGLRWSPGRERFDIDLRAARQPDHAGTAVTLGLTVRR